MADKTDRPTSVSKNIELESDKDSPLTNNLKLLEELERAKAARGKSLENQKADLQKHNVQGEGSEMVKKDANRHNAHPPKKMRHGPDRLAYGTSLDAEHERADQKKTDLEQAMEEYDRHKSSKMLELDNDRDKDHDDRSR